MARTKTKGRAMTAKDVRMGDRFVSPSDGTERPVTQATTDANGMVRLDHGPTARTILPASAIVRVVRHAGRTINHDEPEHVHTSASARF